MAPAASGRDYPEALVEVLAQIEPRHFWFTARNEVIVATMRDVLGPLRGRPLLDVGCGTGFVLAALEAAGVDACGIDMHRAALLVARTRVRAPLIWSNASALPVFEDFDIVTLFDVIEHVDDDAGVLAAVHAALKPSGHVVVTVPAGQHLWTSYDEASGHKRRYERNGLAAVLARSGFRLRHISYFNLLPLVVQRIHRRLVTKSAGTADAVEIARRTLKVPPAPINSLLLVLSRLEGPLRALPWVRGGSLIAIGQRAE